MGMGRARHGGSRDGEMEHQLRPQRRDEQGRVRPRRGRAVVGDTGGRASSNRSSSRALGPHWSLGFVGNASSSSFGNQRFLSEIAPAIEYNLFPYADYASRQLRFTYAIGSQHASYNEVTLFDKLEETNPIHNFEITLEQVQPWGELQVNFEFNQYLHDTSKSRLETGGELSFRITRGLTLDLDGSVSRVRDQLSLPKRDATDEEVLLRLRELQSNYSADFSVNLTYRFGSLFNNIVNPDSAASATACRKSN